MLLSGQKRIAVTGVAERLGTQDFNKPIMVKAFFANAGMIYIGQGAGVAGNNVSATTGFELDSSESVLFMNVGDLANLWLNGTAGDGVSWIVLEV